MTDTLFSQHLPSNERTFTDEFLMDSASEFNYDRNAEEIVLRKNAYEFICITDQQIASIRKASGNTKSRGEAVAELLAKEFRQYGGMIDPNDENDLQEDDQQGTLQVKRQKKIDTALYCFDDCSTYYFLI